MEEDSREDELNNKIRRNLTEWFGPFEEFHERVAKNKLTSRHGLIRAKMKPRPPPMVSLQVPPHESPIPVHVALHSMRNLVNEPLSALPAEFDELKNAKNGENNSKKRKNEEEAENQLEVKKRKNESALRSSIPPSTPDSGVHSTESDQPEEPTSHEVAAMLNIMKTLDEPRLSPIPESILREIRKEAIEKDAKSKAIIPIIIENETKFQSDSSMSSASTSREQTPEPVPTGLMRIKGLKPDRVQKLLDLAKTHGKLTDHVEIQVEKPIENPKERGVEKEKPLERLAEKPSERPKEKPDEIFEKSTERPSRPEREIERPSRPERPSEKLEKVTLKPEKAKEKKIYDEPKPSTSSSLSILPPPPRPPIIAPYIRDSTPKASTTPIPPPADVPRNSPLPPPVLPQKPPNKTVQNLQNLPNPAFRNPSPSGPSPRSVRSTTPTVHSRPSSSLSMHESQHVSSEMSTPSKMARWACQWDHKKLKTMQRVPIPDPTTATKSKGEFYRTLAKDWKTQADRGKDRVIRPLNYMLSSLYFILEAIWKSEKDRTPQSKIQCSSIIRDTYELLGVAVFQSVRDTDDVLAVHILPRIKVLGQIMLSVMQYQIYLFRADNAIKLMSKLEIREVAELIDTRPVSRSSEASSHSQTLTVPKATHPIPSAGSTPSGPTGAHISPWIVSVQSCPNTVTMPQIVFDSYKSQIKTSNALILASRYWEDSKLLARHVDATFIKDIETVCGKSIGMDMSFDVLAQFVLTAVGSLKAEYEEEQRLPIQPTMAKMKKGLETAIRTGTFHTERPQHHRPSQSTPSGQPSGPQQDSKLKPKV